jgi:hypothetical protein
MKMIRMKNKKGISELVSYVLLIVLAIAIAGGVYIWLTSIAKPSKAVECPDVNLRLESYECTQKSADNPGELTLVLKNNGKFDITGFRIMIRDDPDKIFSDISVVNDCFGGEIAIGAYGCEIAVSETRSVSGTFSHIITVKQVQIMPIKEVDGKLAYCKPIEFVIDNCVPPSSGGIN